MFPSSPAFVVYPHTKKIKLKISFSKIAATALIIGLAVGGAFFAFRKPGRHPGRAMSHSQRPASQSEDMLSDSLPMVGEEEQNL